MAASWTSLKSFVSRSFPAYRHISTKFEPAKRYSHFIIQTSKPIASCSVCKCQHFVNFHTSEIWYKRRKTKEERKVDRIVEYSPKRKKSDVIIDVWRNMTVCELASALGKDTEMLFEAMIYIEGTNAYDSDESVITDISVIHEIVKKLGMRCRVVKAPLAQNNVQVVVDAQKRGPPDPSVLVKRPPVVTIMGHVDHGKTTLLDTLRNTSVVLQEFGGITQHIGAFIVKVQDGKSVTFLDTPGHAAFYAMRARGAQVTDIIVLVVAADDGVMQQTVESINHSKDANVPVIVAINKIDKPTANLENCKRGLLEQGVQLEDFGGDVQAVPISAFKGTNVNLLVEAILTQAELMEIKGDPTGFVEGYVIESRTDPSRGKLSTALVKRGTLRKGAVLVAGTAWAKVRAMFDENGKPLQSATLSMAVEIIGWRGLPAAGDELIEVENEAKASDVVKWRLKMKQEEKLAEDSVAIKSKLDEHLAKYRSERDQRRKLGYFRRRGPVHREKEIMDQNTGPRLQIILKGDVDGSVEAILDVLDSYSSQKCTLDIVHYGVGQLNDGDIDLAAAFKSIVYAFNIKVPDSIKKIARKNDVEIKEFNIIYRLIDDIKEEISSRLPLKDEEEVYGSANVLEEFLVNERRKKVPIAGCRCDKGTLKRKANYRVMRNDSIVHEGKLVSLRHLKNDVDTINKGVDCGLRFEDETVRFQPGDTIVCYTVHKVPQKLNWDTGF